MDPGGDTRYNGGMPRFRKVLRIALLALLAGASLNGILLFLFFDGADSYGQVFRMHSRAQTESVRKRIRELEGGIEKERREGALARDRAVKSLRKEYARLDSAIVNADVQFRGRFPKRDLEARFRPLHPFRIAQGRLSICLGGDCFYEETLPHYSRLRLPGTGSGPAALAASAESGGIPMGDPAFAFALSKMAGPRERWDAYRRLDDSTYAYYCGYLVDTAGKRLLWRGIETDREPPR